MIKKPQISSALLSCNQEISKLSNSKWHWELCIVYGQANLIIDIRRGLQSLISFFLFAFSSLFLSGKNRIQIKLH